MSAMLSLLASERGGAEIRCCCHAARLHPWAGIPDFDALLEVLAEGRGERRTYFVFDLRHPGARDVAKLPLVERKASLEELVGHLPAASQVGYSEHVIGQGPEFFEQACRSHLEGIASPPLGSS